MIFTSDHGEMLGAHGFREKNMFYEESVHIPLLMRLPGMIPPGRRIDAPVGQIDLYATILDYLEAGPLPSDGQSLRPLADDPTATRRYVIAEWHRSAVPGYIVYDGRWKLMFGRIAESPSLDALYDLKTDPHEMMNLIGGNPDRRKHKAEADRLKAMLLEWMKNVDDPNWKVSEFAR